MDGGVVLIGSFFCVAPSRDGGREAGGEREREGRGEGGREGGARFRRQTTNVPRSLFNPSITVHEPIYGLNRCGDTRKGNQLSGKPYK